jgi:hypothetical protein
MFLQILGTLEGFATEFAFVRFQGNMNSNVRGDMVAFDRCGAAATPLARKVEVIGALTAYVSLADMFLYKPLLVRRVQASFKPGRHGSLIRVECQS